MSCPVKHCTAEGSHLHTVGDAAQLIADLYEAGITSAEFPPFVELEPVKKPKKSSR
jgi:hypothetical protein